MSQCPHCGRSFRDEAADRIEQLEAEAAEDERTIDAFGRVSPEQYKKELAAKDNHIEQLQAALREIASVEGSPDKVVLLVSMEHMRKIARAALDQKAST